MKFKVLIIDIPNIPYQSDIENNQLDEEIFKLDLEWEKKYKLKNQGRSKRLSYTTGLLYLASALRKLNYPVTYYSYEEYGIAGLRESLNGITYILISSISPFFPIFKQIVDEITDHKKHPRIIIGGFGPTYEPTKFLNVCPENTVAVIGSGEDKILKAIEFFSNGKLSNGLATLGHIKRTNRYESPSFTIPDPDYSILGDIKNYRVNISTIRGCPGSCKFCSGVPFWDKIYYRSITSILSELDYLEQNLSKDTLVHFCDNVITYPEDRFAKLASAILNKKYDLQFSCDVRADCINRNSAILLSKAGFKRICLGIEDCENEILRTHHKGMTYETNIAALNILREFTNSYLTAYWLIGLPGSTEATIKKNQEQIVKLIDSDLVDQIALSIFKPYPGCRFSENDIVIHRNWNSFIRDMDYPIYELENLNSDQLSLLFKEFKISLIDAYKIRLAKK